MIWGGEGLPHMGQRRILVIGSQCQQLGRLAFVPESAQRLFEVMTHPDLGGCVQALLDGQGSGLLLDPTVEEARKALRNSFRRASDDQATLFLAYIGHGHADGDDFYLLPRDAPRTEFRSDNAVHLVQVLLEEYRYYPNVDGLVLLLDACFAGAAAIGAASRWVHALQGQMRFELLTATGDNPAYDGCFTRAITALIDEGLPEAFSRDLRAHHFTGPLQQRCPCQQPQHLLSNRGPDPGLWIARNRFFQGYTEPWRKSAIWDEIERLTAYYQPPPLLFDLVPRLTTARVVAVTAPAGAGKSALLAALARPDVTEEAVPSGFLHAVAFLSGTTTSVELAGLLADQLGRSIEGFADSAKLFQTRTAERESAGLDALQKHVLRPLRCLAATGPIRLALDALDQAPGIAVDTIVRFLETLATDPALASLRVVVTARPDTPLPSSAKQLPLKRASDDALRAYFNRRRLRADQIEGAVRRADGNWLVASLLADWATLDPSGFDLTRLAPGLKAVYDRALLNSGAGDLQVWRNKLRPVLTVLATAGAGAVLPFPLFRHACCQVDQSFTNTRLRDVLVDLRGLVSRVNPGSEEEHIGVFHPTFADHLIQDSDQFRIDVKEGHTAILKAIEELSPPDSWDARNPDALQRYAFQRHAEHLWAVRRFADVIACLAARQSNLPWENLVLWRKWLDRWIEAFGPDHPGTLKIRLNVARWTGESGDASDSLRQFGSLLPDLQRVLGIDHPDTLMARGNIAHWTGRKGNPGEAVRLCSELLRDRLRVLGPDHSETLNTRISLAGWTGEAGNEAEALRLFRELLPDLQRVLGTDDPLTLKTRGNLANCVGTVEDPREASRLLSELLADEQRVFGADHPDTLRTRNNIAYWTGKMGNGTEALQLSKGLLLDQQRVLGPEHPDTLATRNNIVGWTNATGNLGEAHRLLRELLPDLQRVLGPDHPTTLAARSTFAGCTGEAGNRAEALRLFSDLSSDVERVLGPTHPSTLGVLASLAHWTGMTGDPSHALTMFRELLPDQQRVIGEGHPDTLKTRISIAMCTGETGDPREAARLLTELLPDEQRALGADHPDTLKTRNNIAHWTGAAGNPEEALRLFQELLPDQQRVLGPEHPDTLATRNNVAGWTGTMGNRQQALHLLRELLPDQKRILGPDHPDTLAARNNIAGWTGKTGDQAKALELLSELLPDLKRVLGPDHPDTLSTRSNMAYWTGKTGDRNESLRLFRELLADLERVRGKNHSQTVAIRKHIDTLESGQPD
jgi:hypothetical protein